MGKKGLAARKSFNLKYVVTCLRRGLGSQTTTNLGARISPGQNLRRLYMPPVRSEGDRKAKYFVSVRTIKRTDALDLRTEKRDAMSGYTRGSGHAALQYVATIGLSPAPQLHASGHASADYTVLRCSGQLSAAAAGPAAVPAESDVTWSDQSPRRFDPRRTHRPLEMYILEYCTHRTAVTEDSSGARMQQVLE